MDWLTQIATNPLTPWGIVTVCVLAVITGALTPAPAVKRIIEEADARIAKAETMAAAEVSRVEHIRADEVARVEKLNDRAVQEKNELLTAQRTTIESLTESVRMYARAAEADLTTADIVKSVVQALQKDVVRPRPELTEYRTQEDTPHG